MLYRILTPLPVFSVHSRQGLNPVLNNNYKNVCLEGVMLYHTDDDLTSTIKRGILYQCDPTSSNQSSSHPVSSTPKRAEDDCWDRVGCPGNQTFLCTWHNPEPRSRPCQQPTCEHGDPPQFSHSFVFKVPQTSSSKLPQKLKLCQCLKGHHQPLLCCFFSYCFCLLSKLSEEYKVSGFATELCKPCWPCWRKL